VPILVRGRRGTVEEPLIRYIRVLGAALGGLVGLALATIEVNGRQPFSDAPNSGAFLAAWVVAWIVVGFAILPYLTVVPALWIIRQVEALSTAEFVAAVLGLLIGLLMGMLIDMYPDARAERRSICSRVKKPRSKIAKKWSKLAKKLHFRRKSGRHSRKKGCLRSF